MKLKSRNKKQLIIDLHTRIDAAEAQGTEAIEHLGTYEKQLRGVTT